MPYLLLLIYLIPRVISSVTVKKNSTAFSGLGVPGSFLYVIETGIFSMFFYWALNGFKLSVSPTVVLFSMLYGAVVVLSLTVTIFTYNYGSIALVSFVNGTVSLISSAIFGALLLNEQITPELITRILLMLLCVFTVFIGTKRNGGAEENKKLSPLTFILPSLSALITLAITFIVKYYLVTEGSTDTNSLYFMTNVFCASYSLPILAIMMLVKKKDKPNTKDLLLAAVDKRCLGSLINTGIGSVQMVVGTLLIEAMDVAVYTPVTSAIGFVAMAIATPIVKEKLDVYKISATVIAILSLFLPSLIFS